MSVFDHIRFAAKSDIGRKRKNNEDAFGAFPAFGIFCVADGMGGGDDGEVASAATVREVERFCESHSLPPQLTYTRDDIISGIRVSVNTASAWIFRRTKERGLKGCGSTFVGVVFDASRPDQAVALHAGDSRLYRIRGRTIQQVTTDHSAAELIGAKDEKDINPMFRGMILRAVGIQLLVELQATEFPLREGDRILICSDGLSRMVPDKQLLALSRANDSLEKAVDALIAAANAAGGVDNITVELIEIGPLPEAVPAIPLPTSTVSTASATAPSTSATWTSADGTDTSETTGGNGDPFDSETSEIPFESAATVGQNEDDEPTGSTMTIQEAPTDDERSTEDDAPATPKMSPKRNPPSPVRKWIGYSLGLLLLLGVIAGADYLILRSNRPDPRPPVVPSKPVQPVVPADANIAAEAEETANALAAAFRDAKNRGAWNDADAKWKLWQGKWSADQALGREKYEKLRDAVVGVRNEADKRLGEEERILKECAAAKDKLVAAFGDAKAKADLDKADGEWKAWQTAWKSKMAEGAYSDFDGAIRKERDTSEKRVAAEEKRIADEAAKAKAEAEAKAKAEAERLLAECRTVADGVIGEFGKVKLRAELDKAVGARKAWQDAWKQKLDAKAYAELAGKVQTACAAAEKRVGDAEAKEKVERLLAECKETVKERVRAFQAVKDAQALAAVNVQYQAWSKEWRGKIDAKEFENLDKILQEARAETSKRLADEAAKAKAEAAAKAKAEADAAAKAKADAEAKAKADAAAASQEAEKKRANVRSAYDRALQNEPVEERGKRLEDAKGMLNAAKVQKLIPDEEIAKMLAEIEKRQAWTVGKIVNRTGGALSIGGTNVAAGATVTVVFEKGTAWTVTRKGYGPVTVKRENLDGKTVTLTEESFKPSEVTVKLPDGLDAGVVCEFAGKDVPAVGVAMKPGKHACAYRRAGYGRQEGLAFTVTVGAEDARFPLPGKWVASPVKVTVPKLDAGVTCEVDGKARKAGETFELPPGKKHSYLYRKAGHEDQKGEFSIEVNKPFTLPVPGAWKSVKAVEKAVVKTGEKAEKPMEAKPTAEPKKPAPTTSAGKSNTTVESPQKPENPVKAGDTQKSKTEKVWKAFAGWFGGKEDAFFEVLVADMKSESELLPKLSSAVKRLRESSAVEEKQCEEVWLLVHDVVSQANEYAIAELESISGDVAMAKYKRLQESCEEFFSGKDGDAVSKITRMKKFIEAVIAEKSGQK